MTPDTSVHETLKAIAASVYDGNHTRVPSLVASALEAGASPAAVLSEGLIRGMDRVGVDFRDAVIFVPEVLVAARAMKAGMAVLAPHLSASEAHSSGSCVLGTVEGDLHDIGKHLVAIMMEGAGFSVTDLGIDVAPAAFVEAVRQHRPDILGMSSLLTTTMGAMAATIEKLGAEGLRSAVIVMVGGAPVTQDFAKRIGADGCAPDAASAAVLAGRLLRQRRGGAQA